MKKIALLMIALVPLAGMAQKEIKPSITKAEKALRDGKFDEAKEIIDLTIASNEIMVDKKGNPSKNAAKAHYVKGLIYMSLDTTKEARFKALAPDAFEVGTAELKKAEELDPKEGSFVKDPKTTFPIPTITITNNYINYYSQASLKAYNKDKDFKTAFVNIERALVFSPKDTTLLNLAGIYFGPAAEQYDKSLAYIETYISLGGQDNNAWLQKISMYQDKKKDNAAALKAIQDAQVKWPKNEEYPKYELNIYLADKDYAKARKFVTKAIKKYPDDAASQFMLGQLYDRTNSPDSARIQYQKTVQLDPSNFDANIELARSYYADGRKIKAQRDRLGISAADIATRKSLLDKQRAEYKIALPYWEKCEKLKPEEGEVLYTLNDIYSTLVMEQEQARVEKRIKQLGLDK